MGEQVRILIIDDDEDFRASTRALLDGEGYEVIEACNGRQGLDAVREHRPKLIVCDIMMDSLSEGYSVTQALRQLPEFRDQEPIPILMASSVEVDPASLFGWIGDTSPITPDAYMTKPLDIPKFLAQVQKLLK